MRLRVILFILAAFPAISGTLYADILFTRGTNPNVFTNGTEHTITEVQTAANNAGDSAPFDNAIGNEGLGTSFDATWTHDLSAITGETIASATLTIGIWGAESGLSGDQVAGFTIDSTDFTSDLNTLFENNTGDSLTEYNIYQLTLPSTLFAALADGSAEVSLQLTNGRATATNNANSAWLLSSEFDITLQEVAAVPEPSSILLLTGMGGLFGLARRRRKKQNSAAETAEA